MRNSCWHARTLGRHGGALIVDEAFVDVLPPASALRRSCPRPAIVLRSFGKAYGLAGLRLGFALAAPEIGADCARRSAPGRSAAPPWKSARGRMQDRAWLRQSAARLDGKRRAWTTCSATPGFKCSAARRCSG